jgi:riboflavin kinase/FMN adenylyltransferase
VNNKIFKSITELNKYLSLYDYEIAACMGNFDGVHLGHKKLLNELIIKNSTKNVKSLVITFNPHPSKIKNVDTDPINILNYTDRNSKLLECVDYVLDLEFNEDIMKLSGNDFITNYILKIRNLKFWQAGEDFSFGKNREMTVFEAKKFFEASGITFYIYQGKLEIHNQICSSTLIRKIIKDSRFDDVKNFLGSDYYFRATIIHGNKIGRTLDFPTINLEVESMITPVSGVYAVSVILKNFKYYGAMNIGFRPTVGNEKLVIYEIHLFDFDEMIYGEEVIVYPLFKEREEKKFDSFHDLQLQISKDVKSIKKKIYDS